MKGSQRNNVMTYENHNEYRGPQAEEQVDCQVSSLLNGLLIIMVCNANIKTCLHNLGRPQVTIYKRLLMASVPAITSTIAPILSLLASLLAVKLTISADLTMGPTNIAPNWRNVVHMIVPYSGVHRDNNAPNKRPEYKRPSGGSFGMEQP